MSNVTCPKCQGTLVTLLDATDGRRYTATDGRRYTATDGRRYTQCLQCWRITYLDDCNYTIETVSNT
jgi:hypothetical protein